jgi:hypothetical protein
MTAISMELSVDDDEFTADPPINDAAGCRAQASSEPHRSSIGAPAPFSRFLSGKFAASRTFSRECPFAVSRDSSTILVPITPLAFQCYRNSKPQVNGAAMRPLSNLANRDAAGVPTRPRQARLNCRLSNPIEKASTSD